MSSIELITTRHIMFITNTDITIITITILTTRTQRTSTIRNGDITRNIIKQDVQNQKREEDVCRHHHHHHHQHHPRCRNEKKEITRMDYALGQIFASILGGVFSGAPNHVAPSAYPSQQQQQQQQQQVSMMKQRSIKLPCLTERSALEDLILVVIGYDALYSNPVKFRPFENCFALLPSDIKNAHQNMVHELVANSSVQQAINALGDSLFKTHTFTTRPNLIGYACNAKTALMTYKQIVLDYQGYSGRGCWSLLPSAVKAIVCRHINTIVCKVYNMHAKQNSLAPCEYQCSTSYQLFRSRFGGFAKEAGKAMIISVKF